MLAAAEDGRRMLPMRLRKIICFAGLSTAKDDAQSFLRKRVVRTDLHDLIGEDYLEGATRRIPYVSLSLSQLRLCVEERRLANERAPSSNTPPI